MITTIIYKQIGNIRLRSHKKKADIVCIDRGSIASTILRISSRVGIGMLYTTECDGVDEI